MSKMPEMPQDCEWRLIGLLQRNKVRKAMEQGFGLLQAVDSLRLAEAFLALPVSWGARLVSCWR